MVTPGDNGELGSSLDALAEALVGLALDEPRRARYAARARLGLERFDQARVVDTQLALYRETTSC